MRTFLCVGRLTRKCGKVTDVGLRELVKGCPKLNLVNLKCVAQPLDPCLPMAATLPTHPRHTFTTGLRTAGVSEEDRMALTGHTTRDSHAIYSHADEEALRDAISKLPSMTPGKQ